MGRELGFRRVPLFGREFEGARADGGRQMLAAFLIQTEEDANAILSAPNNMIEGTAQDLVEWAESMRREIDRGGFRKGFLMMLGSEGFSMNTHPGFPLVMMNAPSVTCAQDLQIDAFEAACVAYAAGKETGAPQVADFIEECPAGIKKECDLLLIQATITRLCRTRQNSSA